MSIGVEDSCLCVELDVVLWPKLLMGFFKKQDVLMR